MELMKMGSFPTNVSLTILTEKLTSQGMDGTQGNSGIGGVFVPVLTTSWRLKNRKWAEIQRSHRSNRQVLQK